MRRLPSCAGRYVRCVDRDDADSIDGVLDVKHSTVLPTAGSPTSLSRR